MMMRVTCYWKYNDRKKRYYIKKCRGKRTTFRITYLGCNNSITDIFGFNLEKKTDQRRYRMQHRFLSCKLQKIMVVPMQQEYQIIGIVRVGGNPSINKPINTVFQVKSHSKAVWRWREELITLLLPFLPRSCLNRIKPEVPHHENPMTLWNAYIQSASIDWTQPWYLLLITDCEYHGL